MVWLIRINWNSTSLAASWACLWKAGTYHSLIIGATTLGNRYSRGTDWIVNPAHWALNRESAALNLNEAFIPLLVLILLSLITIITVIITIIFYYYCYFYTPLVSLLSKYIRRCRWKRKGPERDFPWLEEELGFQSIPGSAVEGNQGILCKTFSGSYCMHTLLTYFASLLQSANTRDPYRKIWVWLSALTLVLWGDPSQESNLAVWRA